MANMAVAVLGFITMDLPLGDRVFVSTTLAAHRHNVLLHHLLQPGSFVVPFIAFIASPNLAVARPVAAAAWIFFFFPGRRACSEAPLPVA